MENNTQKETFSYTYSANQKNEVQAIREKYLPREEDKMERLRRLDAGVTHKATAIALAMGIFGTLIMGGGMSLAMVWEEFVVGIMVGVVGMIVLSLAYPLYTKVIAKERAKIATEIIRLTDELMK